MPVNQMKIQKTQITKKKNKKTKVNPQMQMQMKKMQTQQRLRNKLENNKKNKKDVNSKVKQETLPVNMAEIEALAAEIENMSSNKKKKK